jgi:hypothetical protein
MRTSLIRRCAAVVAASALCASLGLTSAGAAVPEAPAPAPAAAADPGVGPYISPWGDAQLEIGQETLDWMEREGIVLEAIAPFKMDADGKGFSMPIGSTEGDHLDSKGRIFYPGGLHFTHMETGRTATLKPTWIRLMPRPGYSAGVSVDGQRIKDEVQIGDTNAAEVMIGARPSPTGFRLEKVPFYVTNEASALFQDMTGSPGPRPGSLLGTLTPDFRYIPTKNSDIPQFPGLPS